MATNTGDGGKDRYKSPEERQKDIPRTGYVENKGKFFCYKHQAFCQRVTLHQIGERV